MTSPEVGCHRLLRDSRAHHLPNDRSVDAMLDHPWIIDGSPADATIREKERERVRIRSSRAVNAVTRRRHTAFEVRVPFQLCARAHPRQRGFETRRTSRAVTVARAQTRRPEQTTLGYVNRRPGHDMCNGVRRDRPRNTRHRQTAQHCDGAACATASRTIATPARGICSKRRALCV